MRSYASASMPQRRHSSRCAVDAAGAFGVDVTVEVLLQERSHLVAVHAAGRGPSDQLHHPLLHHLRLLGARPSPVEAVTDSGSGPVQAAHDRPHGHVEDTRGFGVGETVDVDQFDDPSERFVERIERSHDLDVELLVDGSVGAIPRSGGGEAVGAPLGVTEELRASAAVAVDVRVAKDRQQPGPRVPAVEAVDPAVGAHQRVLHEILCFGLVARQRVGDTQQHLDLGQHVPLERGVVGSWRSHSSGSLRVGVAIPGRARRGEGFPCHAVAGTDRAPAPPALPRRSSRRRARRPRARRSGRYACGALPDVWRRRSHDRCGQAPPIAAALPVGSGVKV